MYDHPSQAEPYLPRFSGEMLDLAVEVCEQGHALMGMVPQSVLELRYWDTLQANALHSNLLEDERREEYIKAHVSAEAALHITGKVAASAIGSSALSEMHRALYSRVADSEFEPGLWRTHDVQVQRHVAPSWSSLPRFLERADEVYLQPRKSAPEFLLAAAAAHHRLLWVHPFADGNGRAIRMQSQLALRSIGTCFWSLSAGLCRRREEYFHLLAEADTHRLGDLDGRGNLSTRRLEDWCSFFVSVCGEEIQAAIRRSDAERVFVKIADPSNAHLFSVEAAIRAFRDVKLD